MNQRENVAALACGLAGDVVRTFGEVRLRVFGTSMVPSVLPGDLISVQRAGISEISIGEIVLYTRAERLFAHRVVAHHGGPEHLRLITRGDRLRRNDPPVTSNELLGRVISVVRGGCKIDFAPLDRVWMLPLLHLLRTSDYATFAYTRLVTFLAAGVRHGVPGQFVPRHDGPPCAERASECRV